ncbi:hypothetical protein P4A93_12170 [Pseudomonas syringae pv. syringae]|uniref:hypothetical protein n=1 Tax=Pseudomonas syringae TaxID=317 RepID=UPI0023F9FB14|nr:hypothetical protein [Pseudomonas syringae]MDF5892383.1 hypothetical protein [Pseudomonas syringae pv. syringae]
MDAHKALDFAQKHDLDLDDWLELTEIPIGQFGAYRIDSAGVFFHPNETSEEHGWNAEQVKSAGSVYEMGKNVQPASLGLSQAKQVLAKAQNQKQMRQDNKSRLTFPCTPQELVDFFDTDVSGDLFGCLPEDFRAAVGRSPSIHQRRITKILSVCAELGFAAMAIPHSGKSAIKQKCLPIVALRFTESTFEDTWKKARKLDLVCLENRDAYAHRPK